MAKKIKQLEEAMSELAKDQAFELAAQIRGEVKLGLVQTHAI